MSPAAEAHGSIDADSPEARAILLAGRLAESGVAPLALFAESADPDDSPRGWRELHARESDLPGLILAALKTAGPRGRVTLMALDRVLKVECSAHQCLWWTTDEPTAAALRGPGGSGRR